MTMINWSYYQKDIFTAVRDSRDSLIIEAVAGSGKTSTIIECTNHVAGSERIAFLAFNKSIASDLGRRITAGNARCMTLHAAGFAAWKQALAWDANDCKVDGKKTWGIVEDMLSWPDRKKFGAGIVKLVALAKGVGIVPVASRASIDGIYHGLVSDSREVWESLMDHHGIDEEDTDIDLARKVLGESIARAREVIDFDDMLYMPVVAGAAFEKYDVVFLDEAQDVNAMQVEMVGRMLAAEPDCRRDIVGSQGRVILPAEEQERPWCDFIGGRLIAVGDPNQAIYGFRGAGTDAMTELGRRFGCRSLPLSVSYRCPRRVVEHARRWVPRIEHREGAEWGYVGLEGTDWAGQAERLRLGYPLTLRCSNCNDPIEESYAVVRDNQTLVSGLCLSDAQDIRDSQMEHSPEVDCQLVQDGAAPCPVCGSEERRSSGLLVCECPAPKASGISKWQGIADFKPSDAILCRVMRPLVALAFRLIRVKVACRVIGRDIGAGMTGLVKKLGRTWMGPGATQEGFREAFQVKLDGYRAREAGRLTKRREPALLASMHDKLDTLQVFVDELGEGDGIEELIGSITAMFADVENGNGHGAVTLSTIHKAKGMEFDRVFILDAREYMPSPWARAGWESAQERNIQYVAATRARRELRYVESEGL